MFRVCHFLPVSPDLIQRVERSAFSGDDVLCALGPPERLWRLVVAGEIVVDRGLQITDAGIAATADAFRGDLGEETFHDVQP